MNKNKGFEWALKTSNEGDARGHFVLGSAHSEDGGFNQDGYKAIHHFKAQGLEFDQEACIKAAEYSGCVVKQIDEFSNVNNKEFQAIHLGDVLEHLPNPRETLIKLISVLAEKGIIFIEFIQRFSSSFEK